MKKGHRNIFWESRTKPQISARRIQESSDDLRGKPGAAEFREQERDEERALDPEHVPEDVMRTMLRTLGQETTQQEFDVFLGFKGAQNGQARRLL